ELELLSDILGMPDSDLYDLLNHLAFGAEIFRRVERAEAFRNVHSSWVDSFELPQREVVEALVEKYVLGGIDEIADGSVFRIEPFRGWGHAPGVADRFGDATQLASVMKSLQERLYSVE